MENEQAYKKEFEERLKTAIPNKPLQVELPKVLPLQLPPELQKELEKTL